MRDEATTNPAKPDPNPAKHTIHAAPGRTKQRKANDSIPKHTPPARCAHQMAGREAAHTKTEAKERHRRHGGRRGPDGKKKKRKAQDIFSFVLS